MDKQPLTAVIVGAGHRSFGYARYALEHPEEENPDFFAGSSHRLYEFLIQPAEKSIPKNKRLIIVPDGILHLLPFEILTTGEIEKNTSYRTLPYLIRRNAICYCQSASVLAKLKEERRTKKAGSERTLFAMGDPVFETRSDSTAGPSETRLTGRTPFQRLEHSGEEIRNIASLFPEKQTTLLLRDQATEENLKHSGALQNADYIHHFETPPSVYADSPVRPTVFQIRGRLKVRSEGITG